MIRGINHITLAVRSVEESCSFYVDVLGCRLIARWPEGAYLLVGDAWIALVLDPASRDVPLPECTHIAFSVDAAAFSDFHRRISEVGARIWKDNESEGASLYFVDPNGHKLEVHVGDLASRIDAARNEPWEGFKIIDGAL